MVSQGGSLSVRKEVAKRRQRLPARSSSHEALPFACLLMPDYRLPPRPSSCWRVIGTNRARLGLVQPGPKLPQVRGLCGVESKRETGGLALAGAGIPRPLHVPTGLSLRISSLFHGARVGPVSAHWHFLGYPPPSLRRALAPCHVRPEGSLGRWVRRLAQAGRTAVCTV